MLRQVTFHFPHDTQIRYVERGPRRGERVRGLDGELYVVLNVEPNGAGDVAMCVTSLEYGRAMRGAGRTIAGRAREQSARAAG